MNEWYVCFVTTGMGRGKLLGFPTINLIIPEKFSVESGIYAGFVKLGSKVHKGAFHYGPVETFNQAQESLEVFVLNKNIKSTPSKIEIYLKHFLRKPEKFKNKGELIAQIKRDVKQTELLLN